MRLKIDKILVKSTKWGLFISHLRWWEEHLVVVFAIFVETRCSWKGQNPRLPKKNRLRPPHSKSTQKYSLGHSEPDAQKHSKSTPWGTFRPASLGTPVNGGRDRNTSVHNLQAIVHEFQRVALSPQELPFGTSPHRTRRRGRPPRRAQSIRGGW